MYKTLNVCNNVGGLQPDTAMMMLNVNRLTWKTLVPYPHPSNMSLALDSSSLFLVTRSLSSSVSCLALAFSDSLRSVSLCLAYSAT